MTALVAALVRYTPAPVKARLRGKGRHRRPGRPLLVNTLAYDGRRRVRTVWDDLDDLDPTEWQKGTSDA